MELYLAGTEQDLLRIFRVLKNNHRTERPLSNAVLSEKETEADPEWSVHKCSVIGVFVHQGPKNEPHGIKP